MTRSTEWGLVLDAARLTAATVRHDYEIRRKVLGRFDPDDFDAYEDAFLKPIGAVY